ncbi:MAG: hypothetical protein R3B84_00570 [Zavarzinella sp.]
MLQKIKACHIVAATHSDTKLLLPIRMSQELLIMVVIMAKKEDGNAIYVRTTPTLKKVVTDAANDMGESGPWVIERLIEAFMLMNEESRRDVLQGQLALDRVSDLMALVAWSNHAFAGHHTWAIECYVSLEEECVKQIYGGWQPPPNLTPNERREAEEKRRQQAARSPLRLFARYRQAFSWSELSLDLRKEALSLAIQNEKSVPVRKISHYFDAAQEAGKRAFELYDSINKVHPGISVIYYNAACCAAIRAMLLVESSLVYSTQKRPKCVTDLCKAVVGGNRQSLEMVWSNLGEELQKVRDGGSGVPHEKVLDLSEANIAAIDDYAETAIKYLIPTDNQDVPPPFSIPWPEQNYWAYRFWDDTDILFLRSDPKYKDQYEEWVGTRDTDWLLTNYQRIASRFPSSNPM